MVADEEVLRWHDRVAAPWVVEQLETHAILVADDEAEDFGKCFGFGNFFDWLADLLRQQSGHGSAYSVGVQRDLIETIDDAQRVLDSFWITIVLFAVFVHVCLHVLDLALILLFGLPS